MTITLPEGEMSLQPGDMWMCDHCYYEHPDPERDPFYQENVKTLMYACAAILLFVSQPQSMNHGFNEKKIDMYGLVIPYWSLVFSPHSRRPDMAKPATAHEI